MPNGTTSDMIGSFVEMVQKIGFPIVMVFVLSYVIYQQNDVLTKVNVQQAANSTAFALRMEGMNKALEDIRRLIHDNCVSKEPNPPRG